MVFKPSPLFGKAGVSRTVQKPKTVSAVQPILDEPVAPAPAKMEGAKVGPAPVVAAPTPDPIIAPPTAAVQAGDPISQAALEAGYDASSKELDEYFKNQKANLDVRLSNLAIQGLITSDRRKEIENEFAESEIMTRQNLRDWYDAREEYILENQIEYDALSYEEKVDLIPQEFPEELSMETGKSSWSELFGLNQNDDWRGYLKDNPMILDGSMARDMGAISNALVSVGLDEGQVAEISNTIWINYIRFAPEKEKEWWVLDAPESGTPSDTRTKAEVERDALADINMAVGTPDEIYKELKYKFRTMNSLVGLFEIFTLNGQHILTPKSTWDTYKMKEIYDSKPWWLQMLVEAANPFDWLAGGPISDLAGTILGSRLALKFGRAVSTRYLGTAIKLAKIPFIGKFVSAVVADIPYVIRGAYVGAQRGINKVLTTAIRIPKSGLQKTVTVFNRLAKELNVLWKIKKVDPRTLRILTRGISTHSNQMFSEITDIIANYTRRAGFTSIDADDMVLRLSTDALQDIDTATAGAMGYLNKIIDADDMT